MANYSKLLEQIEKNAMFLLISVVLMVAVYLVAFLSQKLIQKKTGFQFGHKQTRINRMVVMAMLSAIAFILMFFEVPLPFAPPFYKIDISEVPVLIGAFMFGPCAGVAIEGLKVLLYIVIKGTSTAFVGDFANFILGCIYVIPAAIIYHTKKSKKNAIVGMVVGGLILTIAGCLLNAYYLLPKYSQLYGMPMDSLIAMGTAVNASITDVFTFVSLAVAPFNIIKAIAVGAITGVLYKYVSRLLTGSR